MLAPFSTSLTYGPDKLECYIKLGLKGLPGTNTPAYWAPSKLVKAWIVVNTAPNFVLLPDKPLQPSLMFAGKAGAYTNEALFRHSTLT